MKRETDRQPSVGRRSVLTALLSTVSLSGCLSPSGGKTTSTPTEARTDSPSPTATPTETTAEPVETTPTDTEVPTAPDTESPTPEPTETETTPSPTPELNKTRYPVGLPYEKFGLYSGTGQLLGRDEEMLAGVYPIRTEAEWERIRTEGDQRAADAFEGYEFVSETDFSSESIVLVQRKYITGVVMQLQSVGGVGTSHVEIQARQVNETPVNTAHFRYLFIRLPTDGSEIERVTVEIDEEDGTLTFEYDSSGTPTPLG